MSSDRLNEELDSKDVVNLSMGIHGSAGVLLENLDNEGIYPINLKMRA